MANTGLIQIQDLTVLFKSPAAVPRSGTPGKRQREFASTGQTSRRVLSAGSCGCL